MAQVLTNENMVEFIQNRTVPEFKPPESVSQPASEPSKPSSVEDKPNSTNEAVSPVKADQPRDESGKFVKSEQGEQKEETKEAAKAAESDDEDADLPERVRRQIGKKHRAMKEAEEFGREQALKAMAAEARADALERENKALKGPKSEGPKPDEADPNEPKPEDFKTVGEYARAVAKYEVEKKAQQAHAKADQARQQAAMTARESVFADRQASYIKDHPSYVDDLSAVADDDEVPKAAEHYILDSEYGPHLAHYLAKHSAERARLRKLSPPRVIAELGKLEIQFEKPRETQAAPPKISQAPAPITPLEGKTTSVTKDPAKMSFQELRAYRQQQRSEGKYR